MGGFIMNLCELWKLYEEDNSRLEQNHADESESLKSPKRAVFVYDAAHIVTD
jgi:hypothetical protein